MIRNYFLIALRNLRRQPGYAAINVLGLGVGMGACLLIGLFVHDELAHDRFHEKADRIHRVVVDVTAPNTPRDQFAVSSRPMGPALLETYPEVEAAVRLASFNPSVRHEDAYVFDDDVFFAEPSFLDIFTFPLVEGDAATALREPYTAVLTERTAGRYFPGRSALGETLTLNNTLQVAVTGVAHDIPAASHLTFDILISFATFDALHPEPPEPQWLELGLHTYVLLRPDADAEELGSRIADHAQCAYGEVLAQVGIEMEMGLEPLPAIYLHSARGAQIGPVSNAWTVYGFLTIALFVLLIACINYMNLATARSLQRACEVGVRKALGADRGLLVRQFLGESVFVAGLALFVALALAAVALPLFNAVSGKEMAYGALFSPASLLALLVVTAAVGLLAGSYPAAVLSGFSPSRVLKGEFRTSRSGARLRRGLVVFQFAVSVALIVGTVAVLQQLGYMRAQHLGFDRDSLVVLDAQGIPNAEMAQRYETAKQEFLRHPAVLQAAASSTAPGGGLPLLLTVAEGLAEGDSRRMHYLFADHDFPETYRIQIVAGRALSREFEADPQESALLNETAVAALGWASPEDALGKWVHMGANRRTVVGVFRDYHHFSLRQRVEPMVVMTIPPAFNAFALRLDHHQAPAALDHLRATWEGFFPGYPFAYAFLDDTFNQQYLTEARLSRIVGAFAGLAILVACLGLFGLAAFTAEQRRREIGIRKVLGATVGDLVGLLSRDFLKLVAVAFVLGAPVAYWGITRWLEGFAYRVTLGPELFLMAGLIALTIALATVFGQAVRAASADPVRAIRSE